MSEHGLGPGEEQLRDLLKEIQCEVAELPNAGGIEGDQDPLLVELVFGPEELLKSIRSKKSKAYLFEELTRFTNAVYQAGLGTHAGKRNAWATGRNKKGEKRVDDEKEKIREQVIQRYAAGWNGEHGFKLGSGPINLLAEMAEG